MNLRIAGDIVGELGRGRRLETKVGFKPYGARERIDDLDHTQPARFRGIAFSESRHAIHVAQIERELSFDARPQHFHRNLAHALLILRLGDMHLRDGRGGDRLAERHKQLVDASAQRLLDDRDGLVAAERLHPILQRGQRIGDLAADDVGARRQKLPELHIGGADLRQRAHQRPPGAVALAAREEIGEAHERRRGRRQKRRIEKRKDAFARHDVAGARQTIEMTDAKDHERRRSLDRAAWGRNRPN